MGKSFGSVLAAALWLGACYGPYKAGESCDPSLLSRDCQDDLMCTYSYDECPQYGCPRCRRQCREDADCPVDESGCGRQPVCTKQQREDFRGVCEVCVTEPAPIWPP